MGIERAGFAAACVVALLGAAPASAEDHTYAAGQVWAYKTAAGDEGSLIQIREIDRIGPPDKPMTVYHISMNGIAVPAQSEPISIGHLPVSRQTLDASVTRLVSDAPAFPDYKEGKAEWNAANGGVFTISLREIADILREQVAQMQLSAVVN